MRMIGIALVCLIFLLSGYNQLLDPTGTAKVIMQGALPKFVKGFQLPVTLTYGSAAVLATTVGACQVYYFMWCVAFTDTLTQTGRCFSRR